MREAHCTCINGWISGEQSINLFYLIEDKQSKFLVETIEHHHLAERCVRLITVLNQTAGYMLSLL